MPLQVGFASVTGLSREPASPTDGLLVAPLLVMIGLRAPHRARRTIRQTCGAPARTERSAVEETVMRYLSWRGGTGVATGFGIVGATRPEAGGTLPRDAQPADADRTEPGSTQP